ncbi:MAG: 6-pyruvoyl-tetrahydropterin synthase-related protein [Candidatus Levyibacteriota bacterium]
MNLLRRNFGLIVVLLLSILSILPLFHSGLFPIHDDTQVARVYEMGKSLGDGMFPVRWVADLGYGYGYPIFNFYAPFAYYIGGLFTLLGFDALIATKIMMGLGVIFSGVFMYLLAKEFWGEIGGITAGLFYVFAPYHALDIYVRGDVGEYYAYAFIPLVFLGLHKVFKEANRNKLNIKWIAVGAFGYAGLITSHNLTAMMVTPFLIIVLLFYYSIVCRKKELSAINYPLCVIFFGLLLSAFYWLPVFLEMKYTNVLSQIGGGADFRDHFICVGQLWDSPWGFGGSAKGCIDGLSFKIGKLHLLIVLVLLIFSVWSTFKRKYLNDIYHLSEETAAIFLSVIGLILLIFLTLEISKPVWHAIPLMAFFQYPWRFLLLISFFSSFLAGSIFWYLKKLNFLAIFVSFFLIFILIFFNLKLFSPQNFNLKNASDYTNEIALKWVTSRVSDEYMPKDFFKPKSFEQISTKIISSEDKPIIINVLSSKTQSFTAKVYALDHASVLLNIAYFPAWNVFIDEKVFNYQITNQGLRIEFPKGEHNLTVKFIETPIERISNILSLIGITVIIIGIIYARKRSVS